MFFSFAIVASVLLAAKAAVLPVKTTYNTIPFTSVAQSGDDTTSAGLRVYMSNNGSILELVADLTQIPLRWTPSPLISFTNATVVDHSPIASATDADEITHVFFYDIDGTLREQTFDGKTWSLGDLAVPVKTWGSKLTATTYKGVDGSVGVSVWYTQADGGLYEATREGTAAWTINSVGHSHGNGGIMGKVWVEAGKVMKRVYFQNDLIDFQFRESTWNVKAADAADQWTADAVSGFLYKPTGPIAFTGLTFPATNPTDGTQERVFVSPETTAIWEYTRNGAQATFWRETPTVLPTQGRSLSHMSASRVEISGVEHDFMFFTGLDGSLSYTSFTAANGWAAQNLVAVYSS